MTPLYILRYVLKYHNMEAKYLNIIASLAVVFSYILLGVKLFLQRSFILSPVNFYIIPFEICIFGGGFTFLLLTLYFIYYKFKGKDKKAKSD